VNICRRKPHVRTTDEASTQSRGFRHQGCLPVTFQDWSFYHFLPLHLTMYNRSRQSLAGEPNPPRDLPRPGPQWLISFNIKSGVCAPAKSTERWVIVFKPRGFSRTLIVDTDSLSYGRWRWLAPLHLTHSGTRTVTLGHFMVKFEKISFFQRFTCNTVGGPWWVWSLFRSVAGQLFLQYFDAVGWVFW